MKLDMVTSFEMPRNGLGPDAGEADLTVGVGGVGEIDVQRDLSVDTDGLNPFDQRQLRALEHAT